MPFCDESLLIEFIDTYRKTVIRSGQSNVTKAAHSTRSTLHTPPPTYTKWQTDRETDTVNIGKNSQHLMHSMQPKNTGKVKIAL